MVSHNSKRSIVLQNGHDFVTKSLYDTRFYAAKNLKEGIEKMLSNPKFAFVWEVDVLNTIIADTCSIRSVPWKARNVVFFARNDYPYLEILNHR